MNPNADELCPSCRKPLSLFYSLGRECAVCACIHPQCVLSQNAVEGTGEKIEEAMDNFRGKALTFSKPEPQPK